MAFKMEDSKKYLDIKAELKECPAQIEDPTDLTTLSEGISLI